MKYGSRKFLLSILQLGLLGGVPILYRHLGISDDLCKMVLLGIFGGHLYHFSNLFDKRIANNVTTTDQQS